MASPPLQRSDAHEGSYYRGWRFCRQNLVAHLQERQDVQVVRFGRQEAPSDLLSMLDDVDFVFHLAGVNRPQRIEEFSEGNSGLTATLCAAIKATGRSIPVIYTSSIQAEVDNPYGTSKRDAEHALLDLSKQQGSPVYLYRLPNVFGKWARPDYNSAVATFCHNIVRGLPITVNNPAAPLQLVYIDDVIRSFIDVMDGSAPEGPYLDVQPVYATTVGALADQLQAFKRSRETMVTERVGTGLVRALYSTYLSYFTPDDFTYELPKHGDVRGVFVEMLKTPDAGQFSYFTAHPGITREGITITARPRSSWLSKVMPASVFGILSAVSSTSFTLTAKRHRSLKPSRVGAMTSPTLAKPK